MKKLLLALVLSAMTVTIPGTASVKAENLGDVDQLSTYVVLLGRRLGCGYNMEAEMRRVGRWIDSTFPGQKKSDYMKAFITGVQYNADQQLKGRSPDSCPKVREVLDDMVWP